MLIQSYQTVWVETFNTIHTILQSALEGIPIEIEHVGSTAVPGLAAKPIIDIDIVYPPSVQLSQIVARLSSLGYAHHGNQGIPDRDVFKRSTEQKAPLHPVLDGCAHHLYACPTHSAALKNHLVFRDYLRQHLAARNEYAAMKLAIAAAAQQDKKRYAELKESWCKSFIEGIIQQNE